MKKKERCSNFAQWLRSKGFEVDDVRDGLFDSNIITPDLLWIGVWGCIDEDEIEISISSSVPCIMDSVKYKFSEVLAVKALIENLLAVKRVVKHVNAQVFTFEGLRQAFGFNNAKNYPYAGLTMEGDNLMLVVTECLD